MWYLPRHEERQQKGIELGEISERNFLYHVLAQASVQISRRWVLEKITWLELF